MCPGHFWICKFGTVPGSMSCVEKKFEIQVRKWEEYKDTRYYDGDRDLVVELWLHRFTDDLLSSPVAMLVNSSEDGMYVCTLSTLYSPWKTTMTQVTM